MYERHGGGLRGKQMLVIPNFRVRSSYFKDGDVRLVDDSPLLVIVRD